MHHYYVKQSVMNIALLSYMYVVYTLSLFIEFVADL